MRKDERQFRVNLPADILDSFVADLDARGMTQREGTIRLIRFYLSLDPDVRALGMGVLTPERSAMLARLILRQLGKPGRDNPTRGG